MPRISPGRKVDTNPLFPLEAVRLAVDVSAIAGPDPTLTVYLETSADSASSSQSDPRGRNRATMPATTTTTAQDITGGGLSQETTPLTTPLYFQYFSNAAYIGHEGSKVVADTSTVRYLAIKVLTGADVGKIAIYSYQVNNGNKIVQVKRLGASATGAIATTIGSMTYDTGAWTVAAGANGFAGVSIGILPKGSAIYEVNAKGVPFERSFGLGRNAIISGWGSLAPLGEGGQGGMPGQRLLQEQDAGRLYSLGYQQVWGATATKDANAMVNGYVLIESAYQPAGWPDITA